MITEETINLESVEFCGGEYYPSLGVAEVTKPQFYLVESATAVATRWGSRVDFQVSDKAGNRYKLSSWAFVSKQRIKPTELIGKQITLSPKTDKKIFLEF